MAVPKGKTSKSRKRTRSSANFKATTDAMCDCPHCHAVRRPHCVCGNCGFYKGEKVIEVKKDKEKK